MVECSHIHRPLCGAFCDKYSVTQGYSTRALSFFFYITIASVISQCTIRDVATSMHKLIHHSYTNDEMFKCVNMLSYSPCFTADHILHLNHIFANFIISGQVLELDLELGHSCMIDKIPGSH